MTVGISLTNGAEAFVVVDSQGSNLQRGRQSNSRNKISAFQAPHYHGVLFGSGVGNRLLSARHAFAQQHDSLDELVEKGATALLERAEREEQRWLIGQRRLAYNKAQLRPDDESVRRALDKELASVAQRYEQLQEQMHTEYCMTAFDRGQSRIRQFSLSNFHFYEQFEAIMPTGSGADGADWYFNMKMQGIDAHQLRQSDLALFCMNAFTHSTGNLGVGGTPKMYHVDKKGAVQIPVEKTLALANASSRYLAEADGLNRHIIREVFREVLDEKPDYDKVAYVVGMPAAQLTSIYVPYSSVQEMENREFWK